MAIQSAEHPTIASKLLEWQKDSRRFVRECLGGTPDAWQDDALEEYDKSGIIRLSLQAAVGVGKAHPLSLRLDTPHGERQWGDLRVGELVFAPDGTPTRIAAVYPRGMLPMFRVTFSDGSSTTCCGDHLWRVRGDSGRKFLKAKATRIKRRLKYAYECDGDGFSVLSTREIVTRGVTQKRNGTQRQFELPAYAAVEYPYSEQPLDPYLLGVWLGDGTRLSMRGSWRDSDIDDELGRRGYRSKRSDNNRAVSVYGIAQGLRRLGLWASYSYEKYVPKIYKRASVQQRVDVLSGLMDTDGTVDTRGVMSFTSTSKQLASDVAWLVRSLGGVAQWHKEGVGSYVDDSGVRVICRPCFTITVTLSFNPFKVQRKAARWHQPQARYLTRYIAKIEPVEAEEAMCIEVEHESSCYLVNDFIVTHNTTLLAWLIWHFLSCYGRRHEHPKGFGLSVTKDNLNANLWPELSRWQQRSRYLSKSFTWTATRIYANDHPETWFFAARAFSQGATEDQQAEALSGLHGRFIMVAVDESGTIRSAILRKAEQALAEGPERGIIVQAGNTSSLEGMLYEAATKLRSLWRVIKITADPLDAKRSPRINKTWAQQQIDLYGRDNPWIKSTILGEFPPASINALLSLEQVEAAMARKVPTAAYDLAQMRIGVDVSRYGDDPTVLFPRKGLQAFPPLEMRHIRDSQVSTDIAAAVLQMQAERQSEMTILDGTGGWAAGVYDILRAAQEPVISMQYHTASPDRRYANKRALGYFRMAEWVKAGGGLPRLDMLVDELVKQTYTFVGNAFQMEDKALVKEKLGRSPNYADALAQTFMIAEAAAQAAALVPKDPFEDFTRSSHGGSREGGWMR